MSAYVQRPSDPWYIISSYFTRPVSLRTWNIQQSYVNQGKLWLASTIAQYFKAFCNPLQWNKPHYRMNIFLWNSSLLFWCLVFQSHIIFLTRTRLKYAIPFSKALYSVLLTGIYNPPKSHIQAHFYSATHSLVLLM